MSLKGKLNRMKKDIIKQEQMLPPALEKSQKAAEKTQDIPYLEKWEAFGAKPFFLDGQYCFVREMIYPLGHRHGLYTFGEMKQAVANWNTSSLSHPLSSKGHLPSDLFFFDTETTGLGGGAGNTIFLLGHARILRDSVVLKQHFLPSPGAEVALYQSFLSEVDYTTLVTFNGKAFDWPQVKTRHTLIRDAVPRLPAFGHFDLYHASRRIWKQRLESVRLSKVEKEILNIEREKDTPGFLAPMIYFDFLQHGNPEAVFGIMEHNETDILSLITLYTHLSKQILDSETIENDQEQYEMARWLEKLGEKEAARQTYNSVASRHAGEAGKAKLALAALHKKEKNWDGALLLWEEVFREGANSHRIAAGLELAKYFEHRAKDSATALEYSIAAYDLWKQQQRIFKTGKQDELAEFQKRIQRLERKMR